MQTVESETIVDSESSVFFVCFPHFCSRNVSYKLFMSDKKSVMQITPVLNQINDYSKTIETRCICTPAYKIIMYYYWEYIALNSICIAYIIAYIHI